MKLLPTPTEASCRQVMRYLSAYLDGEVSLAMAARIGAHLDDCRRCGLDADVYLAIKHSLARADRDVDELAVHRLQDFADHLTDPLD